MVSPAFGATQASARLFVSMACLFGGCGRTKGGSLHSAAVKKLPDVPAAVRMPTGESKAGADKEGLMPTPAAIAAPASPPRSAKQNGGTLAQYGRVVRRRGERRRRDAGDGSVPVSRSPPQECHFVAAKVFGDARTVNLISTRRRAPENRILRPKGNISPAICPGQNAAANISHS